MWTDFDRHSTPAEFHNMLNEVDYENRSRFGRKPPVRQASAREFIWIAIIGTIVILAHFFA